MSTSSFRHGPQEIVRDGMRFCLWIDQTRMRDQDLSVAHDLRELGASVMVIGENLPRDAGDLVCQLPTSPVHWQFVIDVLPVQLAANACRGCPEWTATRFGFALTSSKMSTAC